MGKASLPKCLKCSSPARAVFMEEILTRRGVLIDVCSSCKGVYLDQGELNFFVRNRKILLQYETNGLEAAHDIAYKCPKCPAGESKMRVGRIPGFPFQVEECGSCRGIFFDAHEFKKIQSAKEFRSLRRDSSVSLKKPVVRLASPQKAGAPGSRPDAASRGAGRKARPAAPVKIPSLGLTTAAVCCSLYGILFAAIVFFVELGSLSLLAGAGAVLAFAAAQFYFGPLLMDWQLRLIGSLEWTPLSRLPPSFKSALERLCGESRLPLPKVGIINDSSPAAYTYGRTPRSARLVFSRGMFELLDEDETEAVLAHELGHIKNWDFAIMAAIKVVPLLLYILYRNIKSSMETAPPKDKKARAAALVTAYLFYLISEYLVLFVSRVREYAADKFSCYASKKPNALLTALVKISYGLLSAGASTSQAGGDSSEDSSKDSKKSSREDRLRPMEALNILSLSRSKQIALASQGEGEDSRFSPEAIQDIMRWDLWSPWAFYYEIHSTHPLTAKRINAIGSYALAMGQKPFLSFDRQKPESYWDDFFLDIFVLMLPFILAAGGVLSFLWLGGMDFGGLNVRDMLPSAESAEQALTLKKPAMGYGPLGFGLLGLSIGALIRLSRSYPFGRFRLHSVSSLLKLIKVSPVRSFPVRLRGRILGRGEAGQLFSEDFVMKDKTGIIYLNHEPFGLNILFALFRYKKFQGRQVSVTGWYRRSPSPYLEVRSIQTEGAGPSDSARQAAGLPPKEEKSWAYTFHYKLAFCLLGALAGGALIFL